VSLRGLAGACLLSMLAEAARAVVSCGVLVSSPSGPLGPGNAVTLGGTLTVQCTKAADSPLASTPFSAGVVTLHGLSAQDGAGHAIGYGVWQGSAGGMPWGSDASSVLRGSVTFDSGPTGTAQLPFQVVVPASPQRPAAGSYQDLLQVTLAYSPDGGALLSDAAVGAGGVTLAVVPACSLSPPSPLILGYVALQADPAIATSSFAVDCNTVYTLSLDSPGGTLLGLPYSLSLDALSSPYDGLVHQHRITGRIEGGLAGDCAGGSCQASQVHWLTLSY